MNISTIPPPPPFRSLISAVEDEGGGGEGGNRGMVTWGLSYIKMENSFQHDSGASFLNYFLLSRNFQKEVKKMLKFYTISAFCHTDFKITMDY